MEFFSEGVGSELVNFHTVLLENFENLRRFDHHFLVDRTKGGACTSTNVNVNEVVANQGLELMGRIKGDYSALHPIDDVHRSQSTSDTYPTASKIALQRELNTLCDEHQRLSDAFAAKAEFADIIKVGRTQRQDAVPMTLGQEFGVCGDSPTGPEGVA